MLSALPNSGNWPRRGWIKASWVAPCVAALLVTGTITSAQELPTAPLPVSFAANVVTDSPPPVAPDPALFRNLFIQPDQRTPLPEDPQWQESNEDAVPVGAGVLAFLPQLSEQDPQKPPTPLDRDQGRLP